MASATPHPKLCDLEDLSGLSEPRPRLYTEPHWAPSGLHPAGPTPQPHSSLWAQCLLQPTPTVQDPPPQMLACRLAVSTQADKVPKTPHSGLGHEP